MCTCMYFKYTHDYIYVIRSQYVSAVLQKDPQIDQMQFPAYLWWSSLRFSGDLGTNSFTMVPISPFDRKNAISARAPIEKKGKKQLFSLVLKIHKC